MNAQSLALRHNGVEQRVCFAAVDAAPTHEFLSEGEKEKLAGFQFAAKKQGFLLGRLAAKRALGALLEEPDLRQIEVRSGIYGQPLVQHPREGAVKEVKEDEKQGDQNAPKIITSGEKDESTEARSKPPDRRKKICRYPQRKKPAAEWSYHPCNWCFD